MIIDGILEKVFKPDYKSRSTYYFGAIVVAGIVHFLMNHGIAVSPEDLSPVKIIAELKASGVDHIDVNQVVEMSDKMRNAAEHLSSIDPTSSIGIWAAGAVAIIDGIKRMFIKYQEVKLLVETIKSGRIAEVGQSLKADDVKKQLCGMDAGAKSAIVPSAIVPSAIVPSSIKIP